MDTPERADLALDRLRVPADWPEVNFYLIKHGRATCVARRPRCQECVVEDLCPKVDVTTISEGVRGPARAPSARSEGQGARGP